MIAPVNRVGFLVFFPGNNKSSAYDGQYDAKGRRHSFLVFGSDADVRVAHSNPVMLRMRHWNEERNNSQNQHNNSS